MCNVNSITVQLSEFQKGNTMEKWLAICFKVRATALLIGHDASDLTAPTVRCGCTASPYIQRQESPQVQSTRKFALLLVYMLKMSLWRLSCNSTVLNILLLEL